MAKKRPQDEQESAAELITLLLLERRNRMGAGTCNGANDRHFDKLCSLLLWMHSEAFGKYRGCRFWSQGACASREKHGRIITDKKGCDGEAVLHEHLFPRGQLIEKLFSLDSPSVEEVRSLLGHLNIGVVISVEEDRRLAPEGVESDPWERYRQAGIAVRDMAGATNGAS
jgi:hypothetical protein